MFDRTVRVLQRPLVKGSLSALLVGFYLLCSVCHTANAPAAIQHTHAAAESSWSTEAAHNGAHEHAEGRHCDDGSALSTSGRTGTDELLLLLALGVLPVSAIWSSPPPVRAWSRALHRRATCRSGTRLLISLCVSRV